MDAIKKEFVRRVLTEEAKGFLHYQGIAMQQRLKFHTGNTYNRRSFTVTGGTELDGKMTLQHAITERFQDIKTKRYSKQKGRVITVSKKLHNRYVYGSYFFIAQKLMFGMTDDIVAEIRKDLENG